MRRSLKGAGRGIDPPFLRRPIAGKLPDHGVEGRREQKAEARYAQHPEEHRRAQRTPHFGACPRCEGERRNAQDEREGCH